MGRRGCVRGADGLVAERCRFGVGGVAVREDRGVRVERASETLVIGGRVYVLSVCRGMQVSESEAISLTRAWVPVSSLRLKKGYQL